MQIVIYPIPFLPEDNNDAGLAINLVIIHIGEKNPTFNQMDTIWKELFNKEPGRKKY